MPLQTPSRVPVDDAYVALVGKAVYIFAYYEWTVIHVIDYFRGGFVNQYNRGNKVMSSKDVCTEIQKTLDNPQTTFSIVSRLELQACCDRIGALIIKRNALIHAHPATGAGGAQILPYQTKTTRPLPDMTWPTEAVDSIIREFDDAACSVGTLLDRFR